jgi:magnesium-transporting ATPase (P-type)
MMTDLSPSHAIAVETVLDHLGTPPEGLSTAEAARRLAAHGANALPAPPQRGVLRRLAGQFGNLLVIVLIVASGVTLLLGHPVDTAVILGVVVINALIGFIQEGRAETAMAAIRDMLSPRASVLRDGLRATVEGAAVVPGDLVLIEAGDRVPADLRLIEVHGLQIQESALTGESLAVEKQTGPVAADLPLGDRASMAWSGTLVTQGTGTGVVVATGEATEIGRIGGLLTRVEDQTTPLLRQMDQFARVLSVSILLASAVVLGLGAWLSERPFADLFLAVVGLAVAAIPEGLPAVMTIALAIGVQAMARRRAIVRRLPAIEAIGTVSVICTDKTGTLTMNQMTVTRAVTASGKATITGQGYAPEGVVQPDTGTEAGTTADLLALARAASLCNDARLFDEDGQWRVAGDPMEGALLAFAARAGAGVEGWTRCDVVPFDARHRFMAVLHAGPQGRVVHVKGAPEAVLDLCTPETDRAAWLGRSEALAKEGLRVLALCEAPTEAADLAVAGFAGQMRMLGLVGLMDPPRPEAVAAVAACRAAGIRVKMITGDHAVTARAIAAQVGLENTDRALTGVDLDALDDVALIEAAQGCDVFARTSPEHKLRLVAALQGIGLSVAMTGDGVNDAPALRRADVGVAMGLKGSEAAKEAADLVLADDNFASIAAAVQEGRRVYDNLRKVIRFELPTSFGEAAIVIVALLLGLALPISAVQILWINMVTGITLGLVLAFEPQDPGLMRRAPRDPSESLLSRGLLWQTLFVSALFLVAAFGVYAYALGRGDDLAGAQTLVLNTLVALEIANLFAIRASGQARVLGGMVHASGLVWGAVLLVVAAQAAVTMVPALQSLFGLRAFTLADLGVVLGVACVFLAIVVGVDRLARKR